MVKSPRGGYAAMLFYQDKCCDYVTLQDENSSPQFVIGSEEHGWIHELSWKDTNTLVIDYNGDLESYPKTWHDVAIVYRRVGPNPIRDFH
jgi:hypothetical protein